MKNTIQKSTRKIITMTFVTLDGVMQAAGGHEEGFDYGGWEMPFQADEMMGTFMAEYMKGSFELLLGKKTYDIFASFWPTAPDFIEAKKPFNETKSMWFRTRNLSQIGEIHSALLEILFPK